MNKKDTSPDYNTEIGEGITIIIFIKIITPIN